MNINRSTSGVLLIGLLFALMITPCLYSQPVATSKQQIGELDIYHDFKDKTLFYYAPGKLNLALEKNGAPKFQMVEMRYTGTGVHGDRGENRFLNVVQFTVDMQQISADQLKEAKQQLDGRGDLIPLPVREIEAVLVAPVSGISESAYKKIGKNGSFHSDDTNGSSGKDGFWTERTFTLKLENHEAQILWDQVKDGQLSLTLSYSFFADMIQGREGDYVAIKDSAAIDLNLGEEKLFNDSTASKSLVRGDAFPIRVNVTEWPDLIKRIDINEGVPPAYAALEVTCYDFTNHLRPDLALKTIDIEATGVGGQLVSLKTKKFSSHEPDLNTLQIKFPYAVKLSTPFRYRVTEYTVEGSKIVSPWRSAESWITPLDITTSEAAQKFERRSLEVEAPSLSELGILKANVFLFYTFRNKVHILSMPFSNADSPQIQPVDITHDKNTTLRYKVIWQVSEDEKSETTLTELNVVDDYLFLTPPQ